MTKTHTQSGFAIGLILLAVVLIAAIVGAVATTTSDSNMSADREEATIMASSIIQKSVKIQMAAQRYVAIGGHSPVKLEDLQSTGMLTLNDLTPPAGSTTEPTTFRFGIVEFGSAEPFANRKYHRAVILENVVPTVALAANDGFSDIGGFIFNGRWDSNLLLTDNHLGAFKHYAASTLPFGETIKSGIETAEYALGELFIGTAHAYDARVDFNGDGYINGIDHDYFYHCFFGLGEACPQSDFDGNGFVNLTDIFEFINVYFANDDESFDPAQPPILLSVEQSEPTWFNKTSGVGGVVIVPQGMDITNIDHLGEVGKGAIMKTFDY